MELDPNPPDPFPKAGGQWPQPRETEEEVFAPVVEDAGPMEIKAPCTECEKNRRVAMLVGMAVGVGVGVGAYWIMTRG